MNRFKDQVFINYNEFKTKIIIWSDRLILERIFISHLKAILTELYLELKIRCNPSDSNKEENMRKRYLACFLLTALLFLSYPADARESRNNYESKTKGIIKPGDIVRTPVHTQRSPYEWPVSTPEDQYMDSTLVENAMKEVEKLSFVRSILIIRNGYLVGERYFRGFQPTDTIPFRWAHGFLGALVGIAMQENYLQSIQQKMMDFFPEYAHADLDPEKYDITIRDLLTMKAGFNFEERGEDAWNNLLASSNWVQYIIDLLLINTPSETFTFGSPQPHLISAILTKATGMSTYDFAETYLFQPLGISINKWGQDPQGIYKGGWDMEFTPRDLARLGYLFLNNGTVDGKQYFSQEWAQESVETLHNFNQLGNGPFGCEEVESWGYGYYWHTSAVLDYPMYFQAGYGGQLVLVIPDLNIILVITADPDGSWDNHESQFEDIYYYLVRYIPTLVWGDHEPPPYIPLDINGTRTIVRSLTQQQYLDRITWAHNPANDSTGIAGYRIYNLTDRNEDQLTWTAPLRFIFLGEVDASTTEYIYRDHIFSTFTPYNTYAVTSFTTDGKESVAAIVTPMDNQ